jgi:hypothetical protein
LYKACKGINVTTTINENRPTPASNYLAIVFVMERDGERSSPPAWLNRWICRPDRHDDINAWSGMDGSVEGKNIHLTELGCEAASSVIRRHMLTEWSGAY